MHVMGVGVEFGVNIRARGKRRSAVSDSQDWHN